MEFEEVGRDWPAERDSVEAKGFFWGELEKLHWRSLDLFDRKALPEPGFPEVKGPIAPWQLPSTVGREVLDLVSEEYQKHVGSLGYGEKEVWEDWEDYRRDQWNRTRWIRGEAGRCVRCGLRLGAAFLSDDLVCAPCFDADDSVVEARGLLKASSVLAPPAERKGSRVHCRKKAELMSVDRFGDFGGESFGHNDLHEFESCCSCAVDRFTRRVDLCLSDVYRADRDKRSEAERFLAGMCEMCGEVAAIGSCESCEGILAREYQDYLNESHDAFFGMMGLENLGCYRDIFC